MPKQSLAHPRTGATALPLVLGASGRLGRILAAAWGQEGRTALWQARREGAVSGARVWDPLSAPPPPDLRGRVGVVVNLLGVVGGDVAALGRNTALAEAGMEVARTLRARHVLLASSGAVYGAAPGPWGEDDPLAPASVYGAAKRAAEAAARDWSLRAGPDAPGLTVLRIGNVVGADALLGAAAVSGRGRPGAAPVLLDRLPGGGGPRRTWIGPRTLAQALGRLADLAATGARLPEVLNLAQPGLVAMETLLAAAGLAWEWRRAPAGVPAELALDMRRLARLVPLPPADPAALVAEWRAMSGAGEGWGGEGMGTA